MLTRSSTYVRPASLAFFGALLLVPALYAADRTPAAAAPPDAVIELWEQHWTLNADGSTAYREKKHVRLNSDRAHHDYADPRITYDKNWDELKIITARVQRADGTYRELPPYSFVSVGLDETAGFPAFAALQQQVLVMSGIETGCVVELEYEIKTKAGGRPFLCGDVRLDDRYPVASRVLSVTIPGSPTSAVFAHAFTEGGRNLDISSDEQGKGQTRTYRLGDLPAVPDEPQAPAWQNLHRRFTFYASTQDMEDESAPLRTVIAAIEQAADTSEISAELAAKWAENAVTPADRLRALQEKLAAQFTFVNVPTGVRRGELRKASAVLNCRYGTPDEAAAALLSLARAAGLAVEPRALVTQESAPVLLPELAVAFPLVLQDGPEQEMWDAHHGRITRAGRWAGHHVFTKRAIGGSLASWDEGESTLVLGGSIKLAADGAYSGTLTLRSTGLFVSPESLRTTDAQKSRLAALIKRVLPDANVDSFNLKTLADNEFVAEAQVKSAKPLKKVSGAWWLALAQDGPFMAGIALPLAFSQRTQPVRIAGPFTEQIQLRIEWPDGWTVLAAPRDLPTVHGAWGDVTQTVQPGHGENKGGNITLTRTTTLIERDIAPADFLALREALNTLRTDAARTLVLEP